MTAPVQYSGKKMETIQWNHSIMLRRNNVLKAVTLQEGKKVVFEKLHFYLKNVVDQKYNTFYKIEKGQLQKIVETIPTLTEDIVDENVEAVDNRSLVDTHGKAQALKREDIIEMRSSGKTPEDIVLTLIEKSSSFNSKTLYSQQKYVKKKNKKHTNIIQILRPTTRLLCEMYQEREPMKISNMKVGSIAQLLTVTNIKCKSKVLLVDTSAGLLLASVLERLCGKGDIVNMHPGETATNFHCAKYLNIPDNFWECIHSFPLNKLGSLFAVDKVFNDISDEWKVPTTSENLNDKKRKLSTNAKEVENTKRPKIGLTDEEKNLIRKERKENRIKQQKIAWDLLKMKEMDALIYCARYHPTPIVLTLLRCLSPSKPFAVYCEYKEPLVELFVQIITSGIAVNLAISDTFTRQYQVLPERTHPMVMMNTTGGFILSGITVAKI